MNPYAYSISLRFQHPSADLRALMAILGLEPKHVWQAGEPRCTPKGTPLAGTRAESYWSAPVLSDEKLLSEVKALEDGLSEIVVRVAPFQAVFLRIRAEGGTAELFLGVFGDSNFGFEFSPELLARVSALGLTLSFDIYP